MLCAQLSRQAPASSDFSADVQELIDEVAIPIDFKVEPQANPPFTFTSKDLVNRAELGEATFPEAINTNGRWVIGLAAPIKLPSSTAVQGTLFVYLDVTALSDFTAAL